MPRLDAMDGPLMTGSHRSTAEARRECLAVSQRSCSEAMGTQSLTVERWLRAAFDLQRDAIGVLGSRSMAAS